MGHHATLFEALEILIPESRKDARYFDRCRLRRNVLMYKAPRRVTPDQVKALIARAGAFELFIRDWLRKNHPKLVTP
jgi:hypothetical protein